MKAPLTGTWTHDNGTFVWSWPWSKLQAGSPHFSPDLARQQWSEFIIAQYPNPKDRWSLVLQCKFNDIAATTKYNWETGSKKIGRVIPIEFDWETMKSDDKPDEGLRNLHSNNVAWHTLVGISISWFEDKVVCKKWMENPKYFQKFLIRDDMKAPKEGKWEHVKDSGTWIWSWPWSKGVYGHPPFDFQRSYQQWAEGLMPYMEPKDRWTFVNQKIFERVDNEIKAHWGSYGQIEKALGRKPIIEVDWASSKCNTEAEMNKAFDTVSTVGSRPWHMVIACLNRLFDKPALKKYITEEKYIKKVIIRDDAKADPNSSTGIWTYNASEGALIWTWSWVKCTMNGHPRNMEPDVAEKLWPPLLGT